LFCQHYFILYASNSYTLRGPFQSSSVKWNGGGEHCCFPSSPGVSYEAALEDKSTPFIAEFSASPALKRRFGAAAVAGSESFVFQGGQGPTARMGTSLYVTRSDCISAVSKGISKGNGPGPRMCHTMTPLDNGKVFLTGGRNSPESLLNDS
jgi:tRNA wybutosine-synthesizing protein 4